MIKINTAQIPADSALPVSGEESTDLLELDPSAEPKLVPGDKIRYNLSASMAGADLVVTGSAQFSVDTVCARCCDDVHTVVSAPKLCLVFEKVRDLEVDVTNDIREELLLAVPSYFYCRPDCKGICPHCGANLNETSCSCADHPAEELPPPDAPSPWDQLDGLNLKKTGKSRRQK